VVPGPYRPGTGSGCDPGTFAKRPFPYVDILVGMDDSPSHKPWPTSGQPLSVTTKLLRGGR
jgi:hypothetical protein